MAGGIMTTACKKEEMKKETNLQGHSWKTSDWILTKSNVQINGSICNEYTDIKTRQKLYEVILCSKAINFDQDFHEKSLTHPAYCSDAGNECKNVTIDGEPVILLKDNTR
ncbi:MAG: hypothetical protein HPY79_08895 [Bacteroidales bacterium]|nr:hypothetical protein [Bacteroidales bacterium]